MLTRPLPRCRQNLQRRVAQPQSTNRSLPCCKQKEIFKWPKYNCRHSERDGEGGRHLSLSPSLPLCGCVTLTTRRPCRACPRNCRSPAARQCADASACDILWLRVSDLKMAAISLVLLECVTLLGPPFPSLPLPRPLLLSVWLTDTSWPKSSNGFWRMTYVPAMYHSFTQYSQAQFGPYCILSNFFLIGQLEHSVRQQLKLSRTARAKYFATQLVAAQIVYNLPRLIIIYSDRILAPS